MTMPSRPPLNGRNLAQYYTSSEARKRSVLREYAQPKDDQEARIIMYDPVRRILVEYFAGARDEAVIDRAEEMLKKKQFSSVDFTDTWRKSNRSALAHLREIDLKGAFEDVRNRKASITAGELIVNSTADFLATFVPRASNGKRKSVAVIVNPSGIKSASLEKRRAWAGIECEVAYRAAASRGDVVDEVLYIDLPKRELHRHVGSKKRVWQEIDATCERIARDWRDIRLTQTRSVGETG